MKKIVAITFLILFIDQWSKIYVKTHFQLNESLAIFGLDWWRITFVENPGMAYGLQFGGLIGKYFLVIVRIILITGMVYLFRKWIKEGASQYLLVPMAMIFAGAIGNLIDGMFYGLIFDSGMVYEESIDRWIGYEGVSTFSEGGPGYSHFMKGCVVDMFHFPLFSFEIAGIQVSFFNYIFNVADSAISLGAVLLLLWRKKAFPQGFHL